MKLHVLADLHTEFEGFDLPDVDADVVVLAGDIGVGLEGVRGAVAAGERIGKPLVYVPGNHEFYHNERVLGDMAGDPAVDGVDEMVRRMKEVATGSNVTVLDNDEFRLGDVRILGTILWSDFALFGREMVETAMGQARTKVNDFRGLIKHKGRSFLPQDAAEKHRESLQWMEEKLGERFNGKTVVVTHHAPSRRSVAPPFQYDPTSAAFASDLEEFIRNAPIDLWVHGHTHRCADYTVGEARVLSNQRGYPHETSSFVPDLSIEV